MDNDLCDPSSGEAMSTALELSLLGRLLLLKSELELLARLKPTPESIEDPLVERDSWVVGD
jgi:hypothetical protein